MNVFDASALLVYLQGEPGSEAVEAALADQAICGAANWSEVAQKIQSKKRNWTLARSLLMTFDLAIEPVTAHDAELAARQWVARPELSLGDRLCLALAERLGAVAWTADAAWGESERIRQIR